MDPTIVADALHADLAKIWQAKAMSPEMKFRAGSDLFDPSIHDGLATKGKVLDWPYIEKWCGEHDNLDVLA